MRLTKHEHACFTLEKDGELLVVDPGIFTRDIPALDNVKVVVVTHEHPDHFDTAALGAIIARNPDAMIYAHQSITSQLGDTLPHCAVAVGESHMRGPFTFEFFGGEHAQIHESLPLVANLGVMINDTLFYPGDSFAVPKKQVEVLALPATAPWSKVSETIDYLHTIKPKLSFPTHDGILSDDGKSVYDSIISTVSSDAGVTYTRLHEPIDI